MSTDFYKTLGVAKKATDAQIKSAYRKLARKYHPDVNPGDNAAEKRFKEISEAYTVLGDQEKKQEYDLYGTVDPGRNGGPGPGAGFGFSGFDFNKSGQSNFSDIFDEIFRGNKSTSRKPQNTAQAGKDLQFVVNMDFMSAMNGMSSTISMTRQKQCTACRGNGNIHASTTHTCRACNGRGNTVVSSGPMQFERECQHCNGAGVTAGESCRSCNGHGTVAKQEKVKVRIPAGVDNGSRIRVPGKGDAGVRGGASGDLYIITKVESHELFSRKGNNIYVVVPVTVSEAALGCKLEVPTLDGLATIRIPPSTQSGQKFRLRERGAPTLRGNAKGDQFVEVQIMLPTIIDENAKDLYRKLEKTEHWNPRKELFEKLKKG